MVDARFAWVLLALPIVMLLIAALLWTWARRMRSRPVLQDIQEQLQLDLLAIQGARTS